MWMSDVGRPVAHVFLSYAPNACAAESRHIQGHFGCHFLWIFQREVICSFHKVGPESGK